jgi:hypothetical protein
MNENESQLNCEELLLERHRKEKKELNGLSLFHQI